MNDDVIAPSGGGQSPLAETELYERLKGWFIEDRRAQNEWYREAESDFAFHAGHGQWEEAESDYNRELDIAPHERGILLQPPSGMSEDDFINRLFKIDREYPDDLDYSVNTHGPYMGHGRPPIQVPGAYDSNSYVSGLLQATGVAPPELPVWAPGYETRLSPRHFGR